MLASITPLGERGRGNRWPVTVTAYVAGSVAGGGLIGAALGAAGGLLPPVRPLIPLGALAAACVLALLFDVRIGGLRLPTVHRQVDEDWLGRYRGWVYGAGFGFQLGLGVVTIVTTSTVYLTLFLALLSGSAWLGALPGVVFGAVRALPVVALAGVSDPRHLRAIHRRLQAWAPLAARTTTGATAAGAVLALVAASGTT